MTAPAVLFHSQCQCALRERLAVLWAVGDQKDSLALGLRFPRSVDDAALKRFVQPAERFVEDQKL